MLDNFEHLISGKEQLTEILHTVPAMKDLVTSRERLVLYGEVGYLLGGIALPEETHPDVHMKFEAVELFIKRTQSVNPNLAGNPFDPAQIIRISQLVV